ncbi:MAG: 2-polyprenyl-3-methyl-5-hydroxy-6-metoxy-1,4-benzoquinol methylase, partial [Rhodothermales bacterium]
MSMNPNDYLAGTPIAVTDGIYDFLDQQDDYSENYDQIAQDDLQKHIMPDEVKDVLLNCCQVAMTKSGTVVDIGAAYGLILTRVPAIERIGVDIAIDYLRKIPEDVLRIRANAEKIPLKSGIADYVICTDVFEHVLNELDLACELTRLIKPDGTLLLATPWGQDLSVYETEEYKTKYAKYKYV